MPQYNKYKNRVRKSIQSARSFVHFFQLCRYIHRTLRDSPIRRLEYLVLYRPIPARASTQDVIPKFHVRLEGLRAMGGEMGSAMEFVDCLVWCLVWDDQIPPLMLQSDPAIWLLVLHRDCNSSYGNVWKGRRGSCGIYPFCTGSLWIRGSVSPRPFPHTTGRILADVDLRAC